MPIYEYVCLDCKQEFEVLRPMNQSDQPPACEVCGGENVKRKLAIFYAQSGGHTVSGSSAASCNGCAGGDCTSCAGL